MTTPHAKALVGLPVRRFLASIRYCKLYAEDAVATGVVTATVEVTTRPMRCADYRWVEAGKRDAVLANPPIG